MSENELENLFINLSEDYEIDIEIVKNYYNILVSFPFIEKYEINVLIDCLQDIIFSKISSNENIDLKYRLLNALNKYYPDEMKNMNEEDFLKYYNEDYELIEGSHQINY